MRFEIKQKRLPTKAFFIFLSVVIAVAALISITPTAQADEYDSQIRNIQKEIDQYNAEAERLRGETNGLQNELAKLNNEKAAIQGEVDVSQAKYDQLIAQIGETEKKIKDNQEVLGDTLADLYLDDNISPLEMLASSKNISEYVDKQAQRASIRDTITSTITTVRQLKKDLETQKANVEIVLERQKAQRASLAAKETEQQALIERTKGEEAAYNQLVASNRQRMEEVAAQQRAYYASIVNNGGGFSGVVGSFQYANWSGNQGCAGGYPYCQSQDTMIDPWGLYNRECVSYVAWALVYRFDKYVGNFSGSGNAYEWVWSAPRYSGAYAVSDPQPGDVVVLPQSGSFAPIGHVMTVESVNSDWIHVSQYNFYGTGQYSTMDIKNSGIVLLRFQNR
jgi:peptidoglycan hydrolase CwlO-like protein/surface antigen